MFFSTEQSPLGSMESSLILACSHITFAGDSQLCTALSWKNLAVVDEDVVDTCGKTWNLPICTLNQSVTIRPLGKIMWEITFLKTPTSFLITFVILRKSSEVITGPPAAAAFTNHFFQSQKLNLTKYWPSNQRTPWDKPVLWTWWRTCECLVFQLARDSPH